MYKNACFKLINTCNALPDAQLSPHMLVEAETEQALLSTIKVGIFQCCCIHIVIVADWQ